MGMKLTWCGLLLLPALLVACAEGGQATHEAHVAQEAGAQEDGLQVVQAWSRAIPPGAPVAAGFLQLHNGSGGDDRLVTVRSDAAERVEIHEVRHEDGMARMRELADGLPLPAGASVALEPGGYHLMFITPGGGFVAGGSISATLVFEHAGEREVAFEVRTIGATGAADDAHDGHDVHEGHEGHEGH